MNTCTSCGKKCRKHKDRCVLCFNSDKKNKYECFICGELTINKNRLCSNQCLEKKKRLEELKKEGILSSECSIHNNIEDLFSGDLLTIWKDNESIFFSFAYPGVTICFSNEEALNILLDDLISLAHTLKYSEEYNEE